MPAKCVWGTGGGNCLASTQDVRSIAYEEEVSVADKKVEIVAQYVSDMHVLESHILQALKRQVSQAEDQPDMHRALQSYVNTTQQHITRLESRLNELGNPSSIGDKAKQTVSNLFGIGAAAVDSVRTHPVSKDLRDDYTAGSLSVIGYVMLRTTALACDDAQIGATLGIADGGHYLHAAMDRPHHSGRDRT